jgi:A/G-specific adenine glycosylase
MLQQTQVDRVIPKYREFLKQFPTVRALASAPVAEVIRAWRGLGYNRRALYLHRTAVAVVEKHGGVFPREIGLLKALPGIGEYTARAILAFAYGLPVPVIDTNHRRFYQRVFFGMKKRTDAQLLARAEKVLPRRRAYDWNQALMDFGSLVCRTNKPDCPVCPLRSICRAYPAILSVRPKKNNAGKKAVPFRDTDRYVRGRILDVLRGVERIGASALRRRFPDVDAERYERIIAGLKKDGLIVRNNGGILLP